MNRVRIIPVLTVINQQLVKTLRFEKPKYLGDPINAIKIFNDKEVDELVILDITASKENKVLNFKLIEEMASEAFMPIGYGGGINTLDQAKKVLDCGVEKIVINSACMENPQFIEELAGHFGSQSIVVSLDYKKRILKGKNPVFYSASKSLKISIVDWAKNIEQHGAGEIILQNADRDGTFEGYDMETMSEVAKAVHIPVVAMGGARGAIDFKAAVEQFGASAVAAGSHFVFKNNNRDSILINYSNKI